jgi:hypothetical protein
MHARATGSGHINNQASKQVIDLKVIKYYWDGFVCMKNTNPSMAM